MPNNVAAFAIHADDVARARRFYEAVFGWKFEPWGPPDFYLIHTGDERQPGVQGLMHKRQQPKGVGGPNCFECTISVDDVDAIAGARKETRRQDHDGKIADPDRRRADLFRRPRRQPRRRDEIRNRAAHCDASQIERRKVAPPPPCGEASENERERVRVGGGTGRFGYPHPLALLAGLPTRGRRNSARPGINFRRRAAACWRR